MTHTILEQAVQAHLDGEDDLASQLFHDFIISRATGLRAAMHNGDETLLEGWEDTVSDQYFGK